MLNDAATSSFSSRIRMLRWPALLVAAVASIGCVAAALNSGAIFYRAYLYSWLFFLAIALGSTGLAMVHNLTGGQWALPIRRAMDAASLTLPVMAVLFIPILLGIHNLYPWSNASADSELIQHRRFLLNPPFFIVRSVAYLVIWSGMSAALYFLSRKWRLYKDFHAAHILRRLSAAGLILYLLTGTHAAVDWIMSRDTHFYSTMFGFIFVSGQAVAGMAFLILIAWLLPDPLLPSQTIQTTQEPSTHHPEIPIDLGKMLHMLVILWAYIAFFQFLVIWMGNLHEDNHWYIARGLGRPNSWTPFIIAIAVFHFFVPFILMLFRVLKRRIAWLGIIATTVLVAHLAYLYWLVAPASMSGALPLEIHWIDLVTPCAVGGAWMFAFLNLIERISVPVLTSPETPPEAEVVHD